MPTLAVQIYSVLFKLNKKLQLRNLRTQTQTESSLHNKNNPFGTTSRPDEPVAATNPTFVDGVATKDVHVDPFSCLSLRIFLPDTVVNSSLANPHVYKGYSPVTVGRNCYKKLPVILQFHGGGFVSGSNNSVANDAFCRRMAKLCDVIVVAVGYRLAPESRYPASYEDGLKALNWLKKQANLAQLGNGNGNGNGKRESQRHIFDGFGASMLEPWLAAHADPSRYGRNNLLILNDGVKGNNTRSPKKLFCILVYQIIPLIRRGPSLKHMPPTLTVVAEHDWMRDRAITYSDELRKVNVDAPVLDYKDAVHEFATLGILLQTPQALACAEDIAIWVKKYISARGHEFSY